MMGRAGESLPFLYRLGVWVKESGITNSASGGTILFGDDVSSWGPSRYGERFGSSLFSLEAIPGGEFQQASLLSSLLEKPLKLKRLSLSAAWFHRAKATVLMRELDSTDNSEEPNISPLSAFFWVRPLGNSQSDGCDWATNFSP
jgi:hypothetical protein